MRKKITRITSIVFYVMTAIFVVYTGWTVIRSAAYISTIIDAGQVTFKTNAFEIINYYMNNCGLYLVFAFLLGGVGYLISREACDKAGGDMQFAETGAQFKHDDHPPAETGERFENSDNPSEENGEEAYFEKNENGADPKTGDL